MSQIGSCLRDRVNRFDLFIAQPVVDVSPILKRLSGPGILCRRLHDVQLENLQYEPLIPAQPVPKKQFPS